MDVRSKKRVKQLKSEVEKDHIYIYIYIYIYGMSISKGNLYERWHKIMFYAYNALKKKMTQNVPFIY